MEMSKEAVGNLWLSLRKEQDGISISEQFRLEMRYEAIFLLNGNHKEISLKVWLLSIVQILCQTERWRKEQDKNGQNKIWETCNYNTQVKVWKNFRKGYFINSINCFRGGGIKREKEHCACQPESHQWPVNCWCEG